MPAITLVIGLSLVILGIAGFVGTGSTHHTALIPAGFGIVLALLGLVARSPAARKHAMHAAVMIGLFGFVAAAVLVVRDLMKGQYSTASLATKAVMAVLCLVFVVLCVRSFIAARRARVTA